MRSRATNVFQAVILSSGIIYILLGAVFYVSPLFFAALFGVSVAEDWFNQIKYDTFVAPLFFMAKAFASLVFTMGAAMVLPLFDPLRYRGLIYFTGIAFPVLSSVMLIANGLNYSHPVMTSTGVLMAIVAACTVFGLAVTKRQASSGVE